MNEPAAKGSDKKGTKTIVIQALRIHGPTARIALTKLTGLSRATISNVTGDLIEERLVRETEDRSSATGAGRPATDVELMPGTAAVIGASMNNRTWTIGAFDLMGNVLQLLEVPAGPAEPDRLAGYIAAEIRRFIERHGLKPMPFVGVGTPGLVDTNEGLIRSAPDMDWNHIPFADMLQSELGLPVSLINRHKAWGLAECRKTYDYNQMIYIGISGGISAGLYIDRRLITGYGGGAGEIGHTTIEPDGMLCPCGNRGCLQVMASGVAIEQEARRLLRFEHSSILSPGASYDPQLIAQRDVCAAADHGDEPAVKAVTKAAGYLGIAMANLVNTFNPEAIVLGGEIPLNSRLYIQTAIEVMKQRSMPALSGGTKIGTASLSECGAAMGAAIFALDQRLTYALLQRETQRTAEAAIGE